MNKFSHIQNLMFFKHIEKQNIQMDDNQNVYKNRTLPHNLQQPAQETTPIYNNNPGSQATVSQTCCRQMAISSDHPGG